MEAIVLCGDGSALGHYDDRSRDVWFTQQRISRASDIGTTLNVGVGYRRISKDDRRLYGAHLFYDHRFLRHHDRLSGGLEYMSGEANSASTGTVLLLMSASSMRTSIPWSV